MQRACRYKTPPMLIQNWYLTSKSTRDILLTEADGLLKNRREVLMEIYLNATLVFKSEVIRELTVTATDLKGQVDLYPDLELWDDGVTAYFIHKIGDSSLIVNVEPGEAAKEMHKFLTS